MGILNRRAAAEMHRAETRWKHSLASPTEHCLGRRDAPCRDTLKTSISERSFSLSRRDAPCRDTLETEPDGQSPHFGRRDAPCRDTLETARARLQDREWPQRCTVQRHAGNITARSVMVSPMAAEMHRAETRWKPEAEAD